ncbi:tyrosine-type recombinase/integrase [Pseudomonas aeruginosa]
MQELAYAFLIALETAMRQGEILGLVAARVHLSARYVELDKTKNGDARKVPLSSRAVTLLRVLVDAAGKRQNLFTLTSGSADTLFRKVRDRQKIDGLNFHDTRHEFSQHCKCFAKHSYYPVGGEPDRIGLMRCA